MTKTSTPELSFPVAARCQRPTAQQGPKRTTLERIRQVARAYTCLATGIPCGGMVLN